MPKRGRGETKGEPNKKPSNTRANDQANRMERKRQHKGCVSYRAHKRHQPDGADFQQRVEQRNAHKEKRKQRRIISAAAKEVTEFASLPRYTSIKQHVKRRQALVEHYKEQKQRREEEAKRRKEEAKRRREERRAKTLTALMKRMSVNEYNHIYIRF